MKLQGLLSRVRYMTALAIATLAGIQTVHAQQEVQYSQYMFNMLAVNPAYAGSRDVLSMTGLYRQQWANISNANTASFTIDMPIKKEKVGVGLQAYRDQIGIFTNTGIYASYAYRVKVTQRTTLSMGVQGGVNNLVGDYSSIITAYNTTGAGINNDPTFSGGISSWLPNVGVGLYLSNDKGYIGLSAPTLIQNALGVTGKIDTTKTTQASQGRQDRHYFFMAGFVVGLGRSLALKPSLLVKATRDAAALDLNLNLWIKDRIAIGGSWRTNNSNFSSIFSNSKGDAVVGLLEIQATDQFRLGYSYDFMLNGLGKRAGATHEAMLRYEFGYRKAKILTPRYF
jgi:type IX secretion system PorP/SprF family membrane protein